MPSPLFPPTPTPIPPSRTTRFVAAFHAYGSWLARISWGRFMLLSLLLMMFAGMLKNMPPFSWSYTEEVVADDAAGSGKTSSRGRHKPFIQIDKSASSGEASGAGVDISIGDGGIRIRSTQTPAATASAPASAASQVQIEAGDGGVHIVLPAGADAEEVRDAIEEVQREIVDAQDSGARRSVHTVHYGDALPEMAFLWILASAVLKITYKGRLQAEVKAAQATETAESESLKRQVVEARLAAMQAQIEPHFLFNTLASIDHLIETDPPRASQMQKHLIALLRASMPTMRETGDATGRDLGRELAVVRPYLEILKARMEDRLTVAIDVPEGLLSAEFPAMMIQTLVENAIRHGLEPKPEGGSLRIGAQIVHGRLQVSVADTGVGFGQSATSGTGVGLDNIRERLRLLHGAQASLTVAANQPCGTVVTVSLPYRSVAGESAA